MFRTDRDRDLRERMRYRFIREKDRGLGQTEIEV